MTEAEPPELSSFLAAPDNAARESAWERLVETYSQLLLKVAQGLGGDHDLVMDRYTYVLEGLRADDFRRVRAFRPEGPARFSTWLVVTARRLCVDQYRARFGRTPLATPDRNRGGRFRRRLALDLGDAVDISTIPDDAQIPADDALDSHARSSKVSELLAALLPRDQLLLQLRFRDGLPAAEIARVMKFPTAFHVYRRVQVVTRALKGLLADHPLFQRDQ